MKQSYRFALAHFIWRLCTDLCQSGLVLYEWRMGSLLPICLPPPTILIMVSVVSSNLEELFRDLARRNKAKLH